MKESLKSGLNEYIRKKISHILNYFKILGNLVDKRRFWEYTDNCNYWNVDFGGADADFRCRMAGHEDYLMQGEQTSTDLIKVLEKRFIGPN